MAPKAAMNMKAMKTATKGSKSVKPVKETATKDKSKKAKDKSPEKNKSVTDEFTVRNLKPNTSHLTTVLGCTVKVNFWFGKNKPCAQQSRDLKKHVATILPSLQAMKSASNAQQLQVHLYKNCQEDKETARSFDS